MRNLLLFAVLGLCLSCNTTKSLFKTSGAAYSDHAKAGASTYLFTNGTYAIYQRIAEPVTINGKRYYQTDIEYSWGQTEAIYFREEAGKVYFYYPVSNAESLLLPATIKTGVNWESSDGALRFEITDTRASLETPAGSYKNLLAIKAEQLPGRETHSFQPYINYYQKGVGQIASVIRGEVFSYRASPEN